MAVMVRDYRRGTRARIKGPGTTTSDSIPADLSRGEFVIKASSAAKIGDKALDYMNRTGRIPMAGNAMMDKMRRGKLPRRRVPMRLGGLLGKLGMGAAAVYGGKSLYDAARNMFGQREQPVDVTPSGRPMPPQGPAAPAASQLGGMTGQAVQDLSGRAAQLRRQEELALGRKGGGKVGGLRRSVYAGGGKAHPGFKAVAAKIGKNPKIRNPNAVLAAATRNASAAAKRKNPRLKRVSGA